MYIQLRIGQDVKEGLFKDTAADVRHQYKRLPPSAHLLPLVHHLSWHQAML